MPPVVDYLHSQFGPKIVHMYTPRIHDDSPDLRKPLSQINTGYPPTNRGYAKAADQDEDEPEQQRPRRMSDAHSDSPVDMSANITQPNEFQLQSRGTRDFEDSRYD